jgi:hypothetical protein
MNCLILRRLSLGHDAWHSKSAALPEKQRNDSSQDFFPFKLIKVEK